MWKARACALAYLESHKEAGGESHQAGAELAQQSLHPLTRSSAALFDAFRDLLQVSGDQALLGQSVETNQDQAQHEERQFGGSFGRVADGDAGDCAAAELS